MWALHFESCRVVGGGRRRAKPTLSLIRVITLLYMAAEHITCPSPTPSSGNPYNEFSSNNDHFRTLRVAAVSMIGISITHHPESAKGHALHLARPSSALRSASKQ